MDSQDYWNQRCGVRPELKIGFIDGAMAIVQSYVCT
jgi:hypothetical protein